jgi:hypothetical protein
MGDTSPTSLSPGFKPPAPASVPTAPTPPPAPGDMTSPEAVAARDRENFRLLAAQGMKSNFLTGLRGLEGGPQKVDVPASLLAPAAPLAPGAVPVTPQQAAALNPFGAVMQGIAQALPTAVASTQPTKNVGFTRPRGY